MNPDFQRLQRLAEAGDKDAALELARASERRGDWLGKLQALLWRERVRPIQKAMDTAVSERFWKKKLLPHLTNLPENASNCVPEAIASIEQFLRTTSWFDHSVMARMPQTWMRTLASGKPSAFAAICRQVSIPALPQREFEHVCTSLGTHLIQLEIGGNLRRWNRWGFGYEDNEETAVPRLPESLLAQMDWTRLQKLVLHDLPANWHFGALLAKLETCRELTSLQLMNCGLNDEMFRRLMRAKLSELEVLDVSLNRYIGDDSAYALTDPEGSIGRRARQLEELCMAGCGFSNPYVAEDLETGVHLKNGNTIDVGDPGAYNDDPDYDDDYE